MGHNQVVMVHSSTYMGHITNNLGGHTGAGVWFGAGIWLGAGIG